MTQATVVQTNLYPCKGLPAITTLRRGLEINTTIGVVGDRNFAVARKQMKDVRWQKKSQFYACTNEESCASVEIPEGLWSEESLDEKFRLLPRFMQSIFLRNSFLANGHLVDTKGDFSMADDNKPTVSILNLASVRRFGEIMGQEINPHRFRMNVWVDGLRPFEELAWCNTFGEPEKHPLRIGDLQLGIDDACERCNAINLDPERGLYDGKKITKALHRFLEDCQYKSPHRGVRAVMGILAIPHDCGEIRVGQELEFLG